MGTNYYRIPSESELESRRLRLLSRIEKLDMQGANVSRGFRNIEGEDEWELLSPWDEFEMGTRVHLGKRSGGWRFTWNFHKGRYYGTRQELFAFIQSGRVVDEYGEELNPEEFIQMALNWCPDGEIFCLGWVRRKHPADVILYRTEQYDREEDGLVISASTDFS
jgi:hypothetical protein